MRAQLANASVCLVLTAGGIKSVEYEDSLRKDRAVWMRSQKFWLFGNAKFKDDTHMQDSEAATQKFNTVTALKSNSLGGST